MPSLSASADQILDVAIEAVRRGGPELGELLDTLPAPIYTTDAEGRVTFYNRACIAFAGRQPVAGEDRWCVTWKLFTTGGKPLPHDRCPMAVAIREKRSVRGTEAVAERPDGTRRHFCPYPTPLLNEAGELVGAVNMLVDVTDRYHAAHLLDQAKRCRRLVRAVNDQLTIDTLTSMAEDYEAKARELQRPH
jgi:PAS domain-containing protein